MGETMGLAVSGDAATSAGNSAADEGDEVGNEDESIVHNCASVGDVEVWLCEGFVHVFFPFDR